MQASKEVTPILWSKVKSSHDERANNVSHHVVIFQFSHHVVSYLVGTGQHHNHHQGHDNTRLGVNRNTQDTSSSENKTAGGVAAQALGSCMCDDDDIDAAENVDNVADDDIASQSAHVPVPCCSHQPEKQLESIHKMVDEIESCEAQNRPWTGEKVRDDMVDENAPIPDTELHNTASDDTDSSSVNRNESHKLMQMSFSTALAIALHNFPEGLATFVASLDDPRVGAVLGVAIAIHNIPEGLCVSLPLYYATGKRWKSFMWGALSGFTELLAAILGYAVFSNQFSQTLYGVLFGMVAGMMIIISLRELLPTAHRYDPEDTVVTYSFISGMAIIAVSLILFLF
jgi:zinc transporter ZupT